MNKDNKPTFQVWHAIDLFSAGTVGRALDQPEQLFPHDYRQVATVEADTLELVFSLTNHTDNDWRENAEVEWMGGYGRSTSDGDVIVAPDGNAYRIEAVGFVQVRVATERDRVERDLGVMKKQPEILLESTRRYEWDGENVDSVYDTCDALGPWQTLTSAEKLSALHELDWHGVLASEKHEMMQREIQQSLANIFKERTQDYAARKQIEQGLAQDDRSRERERNGGRER
jgi:hypothetical protein